MSKKNSIDGIYISYKQKFAYGDEKETLIFVPDVWLPERFVDGGRVKHQVLVDAIGEYLEHKNLLSNWSDKWRGVDINTRPKLTADFIKEEIKGCKQLIVNQEKKIVGLRSMLRECKKENKAAV